MSPYVIYARKSSEAEDRQFRSIPSQIQELRAFASRHGFSVAEVLTEERSAKAPGRPVFGQLLQRAERGSLAGILCWKIDRLARNHYDAGRLLYALSTGALPEVVTPEKTYTQTGTDQLVGNLELGLAAKYITDLSENVRRGNRAKFERGWINHNPPLGYLLDRETKEIVNDPERFGHVKRMWELLLSGAMNPAEIARVADEEWHFRTRRFKRIGNRALSRTRIYALFANPFYAGLIQLEDGRRYQGAHEPMISLEQFHRAQEMLGRKSQPKKKRLSFVFSGLFHCATCGGTLTGEQHTKPSGRTYIYYRCFHNKRTVVCRERALSATLLEQQIVAELRRVQMPEKVHRFLLARAEAVRGDEVVQAEQTAANAQQALATAKRAGSTLLDLRLDGLVTDEEFRQRKAALAERQRTLEAQTSTPTVTAEQMGTRVHETLVFAQRAAEIFATGTPVQRRMILEAVGSNWQVGAQKVRFSLRQPFRLLAEAGGCHNWWACRDRLRTAIAEQAREGYSLPDLDHPPMELPLPVVRGAPRRTLTAAATSR